MALNAMATDPAALSATELLRLYRTGQLSPVETTHAVLDRIALCEPAVNAFCLVDREQALRTAQASEARWQRGEPCGLLDGVPVTIKDLILTKGWPTLRGSLLIGRDQAWDDDAPASARLREHGAVLIGKTTTPEFGWKAVTDNALTGITRNPWDRSRTPGGSSGGAAVACALGMGALHLGTDGGGSIRIPASFSGIFGLKPSFGRVPAWPLSPFGTVAHLGPMTRTVSDAALMLNVLALPDSRDWFAELGADVEQVDPGFDDPLAVFRTHWYVGAANLLRGFTAEQRARVDPGLQEIAAAGEARPLMDYLAAVGQRGELGARMRRFHDRFDLLLTPSVPIVAFEAGRECPDPTRQTRWIDWAPFSSPFNLTQQPAASVLCGYTRSGLPIGLQIVGARYEEALVLRAAHAYQSARPLTDRRPPGIAGDG
jgi:aspartyl-tRNA(Asn)/glutamyl-tRNA(Gln) amidotransferase subunit A